VVRPSWRCKTPGLGSQRSPASDRQPSMCPTDPRGITATGRVSKALSPHSQFGPGHRFHRGFPGSADPWVPSSASWVGMGPHRAGSVNKARVTPQGQDPFGSLRPRASFQAWCARSRHRSRCVGVETITTLEPARPLAPPRTRPSRSRGRLGVPVGPSSRPPANALGDRVGAIPEQVGLNPPPSEGAE